MPDFPVSSIVDNLILMSLVEINNSLHRCISVVKSRGSNHSFETREFRDRRRRNQAHTPGRERGNRTIPGGLLESAEQGSNTIASSSENQRGRPDFGEGA